MTIRRLESISISNFRSIGGEITVPLDAQVVLIHGLNGAGKTSVLSAIELALTGNIDAMRRVDPDYANHLVHRGEEQANITLRSNDSSGRSESWRASSADRWERDKALSDEDSHFYTERCYLAQATLGRLLEIYETNAPNQESALTRFVNDVLGLDSLDQLIKGLRPIRDIRNLRNLTPAIMELELEIKNADRADSAASEAMDRLSREIEGLESEIGLVLSRLDPDIHSFSRTALSRSLTEADVEAEEGQLIELSGLRREVRSMLNEVATDRESPQGEDLHALEYAASMSAARAAEWQAGAGSRLEKVLESAREEFPDLPSAAATSPSEALNSSLTRIWRERERCNQRLATDKRLMQEQGDLTKTVEQAKSRLALVDEQMSGATSGAADVARILASLVQHTKTNECVVCGRDYSEVSREPLSAEIARRAAHFSDQADRLAALTQARADSTRDLNQATEALAILKTEILGPSDKSVLVSRRARLSRWVMELEDLRDDVKAGDEALRDSALAVQSASKARQNIEAWTDMRSSAHTLCQALQLPHRDDLAPLPQLLTQISDHIEAKSRIVENRIRHRRKLKELQRFWSQLHQEKVEAQQSAQALQKSVLNLAGRQRRLDESRSYAKHLLAKTIEIQQAITEEVFNESLNSIWRDLFVRLAPSEPFVPAFRVKGGGDGVPQITTVYRGGAAGGAPGAMLSAGNLNTAALTLFLALHLSAGEGLPFLVLDDPVQSMDDVHISQFAALMRTLSKQHDRQIIVAVHERALFDYLALELSPAFAGDRLITVELKKQADGMTSTEPTYYEWEVDPVTVTA